MITRTKLIYIVLLMIPIILKILGLSFVSVGGLYLIIGAIFINQGNIFMSIIVYTLADICWLSNAVVLGDYFGGIAVTIGIVVGIIVTNKMRIGIFVKNLKT